MDDELDYLGLTRPSLCCKRPFGPLRSWAVSSPIAHLSTLYKKLEEFYSIQVVENSTRENGVCVTDAGGDFFNLESYLCGICEMQCHYRIYICNPP